MAWDGQRVMQDMSGRMERVVQMMAAQVSRMMPEERRYLLTPQQQLQRFLNHTPESLNYIRQKHGDSEFQEYVRSMARIARHVLRTD